MVEARDAGHAWPGWLWVALSAPLPSHYSEPAYAVRLRPDNSFAIHSPLARVVAPEEDWIVRDPDGKIYPCSPEVFEALFEKPEPKPETPPKYEDPALQHVWENREAYRRVLGL